MNKKSQTIMEDLDTQSRHDWEEIFNAITDMVTIHDKDFNIIYANKAEQSCSTNIATSQR
jgi:PAS domain-containing protein